MSNDIGLVIAFWVVGGGLVAGLIWDSKGGNFALGFLLGAALGILGILIAAVIKPYQKPVPLGGPMATRECPHCKSAIRRDASVCAHCQREVEPWKFHEGRWWVKRPSGDYFLNESTGEWERFTESNSTGSSPAR